MTQEQEAPGEAEASPADLWRYYVGPDGSCTKADHHPGAGYVECSPRPDLTHVWNGEAWVPDPLAYRAARAAAYPPITDQLDALWKGGTEAAAMLERIRAVKAAHPKPTP